MAGPSRVEGRRADAGTAQISTRTPTYACMVAITMMGPIGSVFATEETTDPITSWAEWQSIYGAFSANAQHGPAAAKHFFDSGGQFLYTSRVVHTATPGDPTTKTSAQAELELSTGVAAASAAFVLGSAIGPFALDDGDDFEIAVDESPGPGTTATATINAASAARESVAGPFVLSNGQTTTAVMNGVPVTITYETSAFVSIGAATAAEVAAVINAVIATFNPSIRTVASVSAGKVRIETTWRGLGASLDITGGTANAALQFTTGVIDGTGNVDDVDAVTVAEIKSIFEAAQNDCVITDTSGAAKVSSTTTGPLSSVQITASGSTALAVATLGFDTAVHQGTAAGAAPTLLFKGRWDGTYPHAYTVRIAAPVSGEAGRFDVFFLKNGLVAETIRNATMDTTDPRYVVTLVNAGYGSTKASKLFICEDLAAPIDVPDNAPAIGTFGPFAGGDDGLAGLVDIDFYGSETDNGATGLYVFNTISRIDLAAVPGRCTAAVQSQLVTWCEVYRDGRTFAVLATPQGLGIAAARAYVTSTAFLKELSEIAAIYGPWPRFDNPDPSIFGTDATVVLPPEGHIMGVFCRVDASKEGGSFEHPSNALGGLTLVRGVEHREYEDSRKRGLAFDDLINALRVEKGKTPYIDGARTLKSTGPFPTVGESRGTMMVMSNLIESWGNMRNANIRDSLYPRLTTTAVVYLGKLTKADCFQSKDPKQAFFIDFGKGLNTPDVVAAREVVGIVGLRTSPPAEFIFFQIVPFSAASELFAQQVAADATGL